VFVFEKVSESGPAKRTLAEAEKEKARPCRCRVRRRSSRVLLAGRRMTMTIGGTDLGGRRIARKGV
jgi:hypothetical protein